MPIAENPQTNQQPTSAEWLALAKALRDVWRDLVMPQYDWLFGDDDDAQTELPDGTALKSAVAKLGLAPEAVLHIIETSTYCDTNRIAEMKQVLDLSQDAPSCDGYVPIAVSHALDIATPREPIYVTLGGGIYNPRSDPFGEEYWRGIGEFKRMNQQISQRTLEFFAKMLELCAYRLKKL